MEISIRWMTTPFESVLSVNREELQEIVRCFARVVSLNSESHPSIGAAILESVFVRTLVSGVAATLQNRSAHSGTEVSSSRGLFTCPDVLFLVSSAAIDPSVFTSLSTCGFPFCFADDVEFRDRACILPFLSLIPMMTECGEFPNNGQYMRERIANDGLNVGNGLFFDVIARFFAAIPETVISVLRDIDDGRCEGAPPRDAAGSLSFLLGVCDLFRLGIPTREVRNEAGTWMVQTFTCVRWGCAVDSLLRLVREMHVPDG
jgi:hypothetical protein